MSRVSEVVFAGVSRCAEQVGCQYGRVAGVSHSCRVVVEYGPLIDAPGENLKRTVVAMMVYDVIPQGTGKKQRDNASVLVTTYCF